MLLRTPLSRRWRRWTLLALALLTGLYFTDEARSEPHGGSAIGIAYGALGLLAIFVLLYFGVRKRSYRSTWGSLEGWLQAHVYIGLLSAFLILFHAGFRFHDQVATAAFVVLALVAASGFLGAVFYTGLPRRLNEVESNLTAVEMAAQLDQLAGAMVRLAANRSAPFQRVCQGLLDESRPGRMAGWKLVFGMAGVGSRPAAGAAGAGGGAGRWAVHLPDLPAAEQSELRQLLVLSRQRGELLERLVAQQRYRNLLDAWLYFHVPLSFALVALVIAHLAAVLYFGRR
ncbi:MAG TPA: hypothetical protein VHR45_00370 [Thermoanaerobaculia bacterium]|nr:hypothetical protein [Thermoanaerobaculia bacterium]